MSRHNEAAPWWSCGKCELCGGWLENTEPYGVGCPGCWDGNLFLLDFLEAVARILGVGHWAEPLPEPEGGAF